MIQAGMQAALFVGGNYNPSVTSWNPFDKNVNINLSNHFLTATSRAGLTGYQLCRCNHQIASGTKRYWENLLGFDGFDCFVGFDDGTSSLTSAPGSGSNCVYYYPSLGIIYTSGSVQSQTGLATAGIGDYIEAAYDGTLNTVSFYKNGTLLGIPQTVTGGNYYPAIGRGSGNNPTASTAKICATLLLLATVAQASKMV